MYVYVYIYICVYMCDYLYKQGTAEVLDMRDEGESVGNLNKHTQELHLVQHVR